MASACSSSGRARSGWACAHSKVPRSKSASAKIGCVSEQAGAQLEGLLKAVSSLVDVTAVGEGVGEVVHRLESLDVLVAKVSATQLEGLLVDCDGSIEVSDRPRQQAFRLQQIRAQERRSCADAPKRHERATMPIRSGITVA